MTVDCTFQNTTTRSKLESTPRSRGNRPPPQTATLLLTSKRSVVRCVTKQEPRWGRVALPRSPLRGRGASLCVQMFQALFSSVGKTLTPALTSPNIRLLFAADPGLDQYTASKPRERIAIHHGRADNIIRGCTRAYEGLETRSWSCRVSAAVANNHEGCSGGHQQGALIVKASVIAARGYRGEFLGYEQPGARVNTELRGRQSVGALFLSGCECLA